jgi:GNAT superfamily N-acetyltransferase
MTEKNEILALNEQLLPEFFKLFHHYRNARGMHAVPIAEEKFLSKRFHNSDFHVFLATAMYNSGIIEYTEYAGFAILYPFYSTVQLRKIWLLNDLFVEQNYRHQGIGNLLLDKCIAFSEETGAGGIVLETLIENFGAKKLAEKKGLIKDSYSFGYYREHK